MARRPLPEHPAAISAQLLRGPFALCLRELRVALRAPWRSATSVVTDRRLLLVSVRDSEGCCGHGEAAPLSGYDAVGLAAVRDALERSRTALAHLAADASAEPSKGHGPARRARPIPPDAGAALRSQLEVLLARRASDQAPPQARAALEMALLDLAGRRSGTPIWRLLGGNGASEAERAPQVEVNGVIDALDPAQAQQRASALVRAGFRCLKVKVGTGAEADRARVAAVRRAAGDAAALRLDANGAWSVAEAIEQIHALARFDLELVEEPVHGAGALRAVRAAVAVPIAADESADEDAILAGGAIDAICLKLGRCGGVLPLLEKAARARAHGITPYIASTLEGALGIAAALHAATLLALEGPLAPCGLATLPLLDCEAPGLEAHGGLMRAPAAPGLGVQAPA
jgi:L-alanine-DL-glutamate epimerase-like enolase superfamily enzyme